MIKIRALYIFTLFPAFLFSQTKNFIEKKDSLLPGTITSIPFTVENKFSVRTSYDLTVETSDPNIIPILTKGEIEISPAEKTIYLVPVKIASETPHGKYAITLYGSEKSTGEKFSKHFEFIISESRKLSLTSLNAPEFVKAGESITSTFLLKNNGNFTENLILESKNAIIDQNAALILSAGEQKIITVLKKTNPELGKNEMQNIMLSVYSADNPKENQSAYTSVKIISVKPSEEDIFHRLPAAFSLAFTGMQNRGEFQNGFQGEIYGKGSLDKENRNLIEFHAVTKNPVAFNSFTKYEEYFVNYKRENFFIHLGDKNYFSSFLTEYARYGRGAEVRYDTEKLSFGGFYNHPRFFRDIQDEFNVYSKIKITKESEITAGYLYKIPRKDNSLLSFSGFRFHSDAQLPYLAGKFKLNKSIEISGETSYSKTGKTEGSAFMLQTVANFNKISGNLMYMHSSPEYAGYFNNTNTFNGNIQFQIFNKVNIFANYVQDAKNFQRDTLLLAAPYRKYLQYGIQYRYTKKGSITIFNGFQRYEDRLIPKEFDYKEQFFRISMEQQLGIFQLNFESQFGKTNNYLLNFSGNSSFYTANVGFEKFRTSFNIYGSYAVTSRYQIQNQKQMYYGVRILSRFSQKTNFSLSYQNNYMPEEYFADRNLFELIFHQQIFPGHEFDLSGRYTLQRGELGNKDFIFSLRYTARLDIPTQKTADYAALYGTINNLGVKKVDGIRILLGHYLSVTDKSGNFVFKNVIPGNYVLEIDRSTGDINDIPDIDLPASVTISNSENIFNFGLTSSSQIQGKIEYSESPKPDFVQLSNKKDNKKRESIMLEISNGNQIYRKIIDVGENFDFTYLRPGEWKVKVYRNGLDKKYKIPVDHFDFILKPSEIKTLIISVIKQQSEIKFQQEPIKVTYNEFRKKK
ncbi:COG1470 family protein [Chryseobacterium sp. VD8]|uniref:COG1470 family protein n=1 Tax=Chryseobacterium sp. VD8 TaxID=3081254 RepID=UPI003018BBB4